MKTNLYDICPKIGQQPTAEIACDYLTNIQDLHMAGDIMGCISRIVKRGSKASKYVEEVTIIYMQEGGWPHTLMPCSGPLLFPSCCSAAACCNLTSPSGNPPWTLLDLLPNIRALITAFDVSYPNQDRWGSFIMTVQNHTALRTISCPVHVPEQWPAKEVTLSRPSIRREAQQGHELKAMDLLSQCCLLWNDA